MEINVELMLPRDERTVPVARHLCRQAMRELGVDPECYEDVELALSEACTNVLRHADDGDQYEVSLFLDDRCCTVRVVDHGRGFDAMTAGEADTTGPVAESGRGLGLMRALVDRVEFQVKPHNGTIVHLEKELRFDGDSPLRPTGA